MKNFQRKFLFNVHAECVLIPFSVCCMRVRLKRVDRLIFCVLWKQTLAKPNWRKTPSTLKNSKLAVANKGRKRARTRKRVRENHLGSVLLMILSYTLPKKNHITHWNVPRSPWTASRHSLTDMQPLCVQYEVSAASSFGQLRQETNSFGTRNMVHILLVDKKCFQARREKCRSGGCVCVTSNPSQWHALAMFSFHTSDRIEVEKYTTRRRKTTDKIEMPEFICRTMSCRLREQESKRDRKRENLK